MEEIRNRYIHAVSQVAIAKGNAAKAYSKAAAAVLNGDMQMAADLVEEAKAYDADAERLAAIAAALKAQLG